MLSQCYFICILVKGYVRMFALFYLGCRDRKWKNRGMDSCICLAFLFSNMLCIYDDMSLFLNSTKGIWFSLYIHGTWESYMGSTRFMWNYYSLCRVEINHPTEPQGALEITTETTQYYIGFFLLRLLSCRPNIPLPYHSWICCIRAGARRKEGRGGWGRQNTRAQSNACYHATTTWPILIVNKNNSFSCKMQQQWGCLVFHAKCCFCKAQITFHNGYNEIVFLKVYRNEVIVTLLKSSPLLLAFTL